jgi:hypothetical protein
MTPEQRNKLMESARMDNPNRLSTHETLSRVVLEHTKKIRELEYRLFLQHLILVVLTLYSFMSMFF